jgi:hypothetical protein
VSPTAGFWIALAGGLALARAGARHGARVGYGASIAAMLQTVAVMGPVRFGIPLTQALTAPLLGRLEARRRPVLWQVVVCAAIRLAQTGLFVAFFVLVLAGGVDSYTDSYDWFASWIPLLPEGTTAALIATAVTLLGWAAFASTVQVLVYRRGLSRWPAPDGLSPHEQSHPAGDLGPEPLENDRRRFDPRAVALAAVIAFATLMASTAWPVLAAVTAWLVLASLIARGDRSVVPLGAAITAFLALSVFVFLLLGGSGLDLALRRGLRAGLLVAVATWLRAAAGAGGLREVSRRALRRLHRLPAAREANLALGELGSGRQLGPAVSSAVDALRGTSKRPLPVLDAILRWVAAESARFRADRSQDVPRLHARPLDWVLVAAVLAAGSSLLLA